MSSLLNLEDLIIKLFDKGGILFDDFVVRTGEKCPVYINMRVIWSYPDIVRTVSEMIWTELEEQKLKKPDALLGLPYQGIPIATYLSTKYDIPMLLKRQETKQYGTKKMVEGHFTEGETNAILVDDVIMTGGTLVEDIPVLENEGLKVSGVVCFFDRVQGGTERVKHKTNVDVYSVISLPKAMEILVRAGKITQEKMDSTMTYLKENRFDTEKYGVKKGDSPARKAPKVE